MSDIINRVAAAIYESDVAESTTISADEGVRRWRDWPGMRDMYRRRAMAAIASMREPTEAMLSVRDNIVTHSGAITSVDAHGLNRIWQAMIDVAFGVST